MILISNLSFAFLKIYLNNIPDVLLIKSKGGKNNNYGKTLFIHQLAIQYPNSQ